MGKKAWKALIIFLGCSLGMYAAMRMCVSNCELIICVKVFELIGIGILPFKDITYMI